MKLHIFSFVLAGCVFQILGENESNVIAANLIAETKNLLANIGQLLTNVTEQAEALEEINVEVGTQPDIATVQEYLKKCEASGDLAKCSANFYKKIELLEKDLPEYEKKTLINISGYLHSLETTLAKVQTIVLDKLDEMIAGYENSSENGGNKTNLA